MIIHINSVYWRANQNSVRYTLKYSSKFSSLTPLSFNKIATYTHWLIERLSCPCVLNEALLVKFRKELTEYISENRNKYQIVIVYEENRQIERLSHLHLLPTGNQQLPVNAHNNFCSLEVLISQFLVTPLLKSCCNLITKHSIFNIKYSIPNFN